MTGLRRRNLRIGRQASTHTGHPTAEIDSREAVIGEAVAAG
jgi:hypothetical protein